MLGNKASRRIFWATVIMALVSTVAAVATVVNGWFDFVEIASPGNPSAGRSRLYSNSTSHRLTCLTSSGSDCFPAGTVFAGGVNSQTTNYTADSTDNGKLISFSNGSPITLTLPSSAPSSTWWIGAQDVGAGALTIARNGHNIDGAAADVVVNQNQGLLVYTDGTNWFTTRGYTTDASLQTSNITTNNVSTSKHGFVPVAPNDATKYLDGTGVFTVPSGTGGAPSITSGTYASIPGTCTTGSVYFATDSLYSRFFCQSTNTWVPMIGSYIATLPPAVGTLTGFNVGTITTNTTFGSLQLIGGTGSDQNTWRGYYNAAALTTRFTIIVAISIDSGTSTTVPAGRCGILLHQSSTNNAMAFEAFIGTGAYTWNGSNITSAGAAVGSNFTSNEHPVGFQGLAWMSVLKNGTNYVLQMSYDGGKKWATKGNITLANFDGYGVFVKNDTASQQTYCEILDWEAT